MAAILILILILLTGAVCIRRYGAVSIPGVAILGMAVYSVPVLIGYYNTPFSAGRFYEVASTDATLVMALAWLVFGAVLVFNPLSPLTARPSSFPERRANIQALNDAILALFFVNLLGLAAIVFQEGAFFFLADRADALAASSGVTSFWRWTNMMGLVLCAFAGRRLLLTYFIVTTILYYVAGDRTIIIISVFSVVVMFFRGISLGRLVRNPRIIGLGLFTAFIALFGKALYLAIKYGDFTILVTGVSRDDNVQLYSGFEPMLVHGHLETVMSSGFTYSWVDVAIGTLGQVLIVPSAFGIDSQKFNVVFTATNYPGITYGLAYSYWAEGYAVAGVGGVVAFAVILGLMTVAADHAERVAKPLARALFVMLGCTVGIYIYRNSLENIFVFIRQILIVFVFVVIGGKLIGLRRGQTGHPATIR